MTDQLINENDPLKTAKLDLELIACFMKDPENKRFRFDDKEGTPIRTGIMAELLKIYSKGILPEHEHVNLENWDFASVVTRLALMDDAHRGPMGTYSQLDRYDMFSQEIYKDADGIGAIVFAGDLVPDPRDKKRLQLNSKTYGPCFNLNRHSAFFDQTIGAGPICAGFLVAEDVMVGAGPMITPENMADLRIVLGYEMTDEDQVNDTFSPDQIFRVVKIIRNPNDPRGWALMKLDRPVEGREPLDMFHGEIKKDQSLHAVGHPLGLPLKYISGAYVLETSAEEGFSANLGIYGSGCGSAVFDLESHRVVGVVNDVSYPGFRWIGHCWVAITNTGSTGAEAVRCTGINTFKDKITYL